MQTRIFKINFNKKKYLFSKKRGYIWFLLVTSLLLMFNFKIFKVQAAVGWIDPVDITPSTASSWVDVDVSTDIPSTATGVMLHINNDSGTNRNIGFRKNGSTDNRTNVLKASEHMWAAIGVDSNQILELYVGSSSDITIYLVGYFTDEAVFFTNATDKSLGSVNTWTDIDISSDSGSDTAIGAIFEVIDTGNGYRWYDFRKNGSTDDNSSNSNDIKSHNGVIIGVDSNEICEGIIERNTVDFYLVGYITKDVTFNTNATDMSISTTEVWTDLTALPSGATGGLFSVVLGVYDTFGLRKNGSTENIVSNYPHTWAMIEADSSRLIEGYTDNGYVKFYLVGYTTASVSNATPTITSVTDSPDPVTTGKDVNFSVDWNDGDSGENIKTKICKTSSLTNQNCDGGYWASSTAFTTSDPESVSYTAQTADSGLHNYYAFVCDDEGACSSSTSGNFTVAPTVTSVTDSPDPIGVGAKITFSVNWNDDNGDMVKVHICKGSGIATSTQTCSDGAWANSDVFTNRDPENQVFYTTVSADKGNTRNYWVFVCDDDNACSDGTAGIFTVENQRPDEPTNLLIEGMEVGKANNLTDTTPEFRAIYKDSNDEGDVATGYCIEVDTQADFTGTQMWTTDSDSCYTSTAIGSSVAEGEYTPEFSYNGSPLSMDGTVYYWRIWLWDEEERSATSTTGWFNMVANVNGGGARLQSGRFKGGIRLQ